MSPSSEKCFQGSYKMAYPFFLQIIVLTLLLISHKTFSQNVGAQDNLNRISASPGIVMTYDSRYEGIKGTPNVFTTFMTGTIVLNNGASYKDVLLNIDGYKNAVLYRTCSNCEVKILDKSKIVNFNIIDQGSERNFILQNVVDKGSEIREILWSGKHSYYRVYKVDLIKADYQGAYSGNRKYDSFEMSTKYFVEKESLLEIKLKSKQLKKVFPEKAEIIESYLKSIKSDLSQDANIKSLFKLIDQS